MPDLRYEVRIDWSDEDGAYVALVPELPGCMTHGATYQAAAANAVEAMTAWIKSCRSAGQPVPVPRSAVVF